MFLFKNFLFLNLGQCFLSALLIQVENLPTKILLPKTTLPFLLLFLFLTTFIQGSGLTKLHSFTFVFAIDNTR